MYQESHGKRFEHFGSLLTASFESDLPSLYTTINHLMEHCFFEDSLFAQFITNHSHMKSFSLRVLRYWLANLYTLSEESEVKLVSFLKVVLTKTHFAWLPDLLSLTTDFIARAHPSPLFRDTGLPKVLNILQIFSTMNSLVPRQTYALLSGLDQSGVTVDFQKSLEAHNFFLSKNFTIVVNFATELHLLVQQEEPSYLFRFTKVNPEAGYGVYFLYDKLYFYYRLPSKAPNALNEFVIFEDIAMIVSNKWNHFSFSCHFNPESMTSHLSVTLNYQRFHREFDFGNFISSNHSYRLHFLQNIPATLSTILALNRPLKEAEFVRLQTPVAQQGILNAQSFEAFNEVFLPASRNSDTLFFWHGFCEVVADAEDGGWVSRDSQNGLPVTFGAHTLPINFTGSAYTHSMLKGRFVECLSPLFLYIQHRDELNRAIRIIKNVIENKQLSDALVHHKEVNFLRLLLGSILLTPAAGAVDLSTLPSLQFGFADLPATFLRPFLAKYLLDFHFIDRLLKTEESSKQFFDGLTAKINQNFSLVHAIDFNRLFGHAILFLERSDPLSSSKALELLKLLACSMSILSCASRFDVNSLLLLCCRPADLGTPVQLLLVAALKARLKQKPLDKDAHGLFFGAICNLIVRTSEANVIKKAMRVALFVDPTCEKFLLFSLRCRFRQSGCLERTKKIFAGYLTDNVVLPRAELLVNYVMRLTFLNLSKDRVYSNDSMVVSPYGLINLLFEISLVAEPVLLERILQSLWVAAKQQEQDFLAKTSRRHYLVWLLCLMFRFFKSPESKSIYDLCDRLLLLHSRNCLKHFANSDFFNQIAEIVHFFSLETGNHEVKYHIFIGVLGELNASDQFVRSESALNEFLLCLMKYYYINLQQERVDDLHPQIFEQIFLFLQANVNNNPTAGFVPKLMEPVGAAPKQSLVRSMVQSPLSLFSRPKVFYKAEDCTLKFLTVFAIHILQEVVSKKEVQVLTPSWPEFLNGFAYRFLNYLENNRPKLKPEKSFTLEVCLYYLYKFTVDNSTRIKNYDEIMKSAYFHADESIYKNSFAKKLIERLLDQFDYRSRTLDRSTLDGRPNRVIEEYIDPDFEGVYEVYAVEVVGKINQLLQGLQDLDSVYFTVDDVALLAGYTGAGFAKLVVEWEGLRNQVWLQRTDGLRKLHQIFSDNMERISQIGAPLCPVESPSVALDEPLTPFAPPPYQPQEPDQPEWNLRPYVTSELKRPFLYQKVSPVFSTPQLDDRWDLPRDFSLEAIAKHLRTTPYVCHQIQGFELVPTIAAVDKANKKLILFVDISEKKRPELTVLKQWTLSPTDRLVRKIPFAHLKTARLSKFLRKRTACMLTRNDRQKLLLNFESHVSCLSFLGEVGALISQAQGKQYTPHQAAYSLRNMVARWRESQMSNFQFLMRLNGFAARSYEDYSQYPIFPLLTKEFGEKVVLRDLELPVGMAGDAKRSSTILSRFQSASSFEDIPPFHYGSHYSSPTSVFNFLIRLPPNDEGARLIHNGTFDLPDRLFFSIATMLKNVNEETCDLRELVPEFYSTPEVFLNLNNLNFGVNHEGLRVHHVHLPAACQENPYRFVYFMSQMLESQSVSGKLHAWIDLIFGYKQTGDEARKSHNLFHHLTYEEGTGPGAANGNSGRSMVQSALASPRDLTASALRNGDFASEAPTDAEMTQVYHFGQTPFLLFDQPVKPKEPLAVPETLSSSHAKLKYFIRLRSDEPIDPSRLLYFRRVRRTGSSKEKELSSFLAIYENQVEVWRLSDTISQYNPKNPFNLMLESAHKLDAINQELLSFGQLAHLRHVVEAYMFNRLMWGGLAGGAVAIFNFLNGQLLSKAALHEFPVVALVLTPKEVVVTVDSQGIIKLSKLGVSTNTLTPLATIFSHFGQPVTGLSIVSNDKQLFGYQTDREVVIRSTDAPSLSLFHLPKSSLGVLGSREKWEIVLSFSYLNVLVIHTFHEGTNHLVAVSLLGQVLGQYSEKAGTEGPYRFFEVIRDECFKDHIACITSNGNVLILDLPFFEVKKQYRSYQNIVILKVCVVNRRRCLLLMDEQRCIDIICVDQGKEELLK